MTWSGKQGRAFVDLRPLASFCPIQALPMGFICGLIHHLLVEVRPKCAGPRARVHEPGQRQLVYFLLLLH